MNKVFGCGAALAMLAFVTICAGFMLPLELVVFIAFGWIAYLYRVLPQVQVNVSGVATGLIACAVFVVGFHAFMRWLLESASRTDAADSAAASGEVRLESGITTASDKGSDKVDGDAFASRPPVAWRLGWTLKILTVVAMMFVAGISIIGIAHQTVWLMTSSQPIISRGAPESARRNTSMNNMKQIGLGLHNYHDAHKTFPPGARIDERGKSLHSWLTMILPYIEEVTLYRQIDKSEAWDSPENRAALHEVVGCYLNPSIRSPEQYDANGYALSQYAANVFALGGAEPRKLNSFADGTSKTIIAGEAAGNFIAWGKPGAWRDPRLGVNKSADGFGGSRPDVTLFLFADGSVRAISDDIDQTIFESLATPNGGEDVSHWHDGRE